jgi:hypothetical protein
MKVNPVNSNKVSIDLGKYKAGFVVSLQLMGKWFS